MVAGKRVTVLGAARSGLAAASLLRSAGARVFVSEQRPEEAIKDTASELRSLGVGLETGGHTDAAIDADLIVVSPGVPSSALVVRGAVARGIPVYSEIEAASWFCRAPIVAVTGSNGKTTTTVLAGEIFKNGAGAVPARRVFVRGNVGDAFAGIAGEARPGDIVVLEVSSFQLDHVERFHPRVALLLNITPDHLDRYDRSFEKYIASKMRIAVNLTPDDALIYWSGDEVLRREVERLPAGHGTKYRFNIEDDGAAAAFVREGVLVLRLHGKEEPLIPPAEIAIKGTHNLLNSMGAALAAWIMGVTGDVIARTLRMFRGVEHRLEFVAEIGGVAYVNDSKATNVDSVWYALQSFTGRRIVLLLGGRDKGNDYTRLLALVKENVRMIVAIGESADKVVGAFQDVVPVVRALTMEEAVKAAQSRAGRGDVVLLSPACASFDWFEDYEHRGRAFKKIVGALPQ